MTSNDWFYISQGLRKGPVSLDQLQDLLVTTLPPQTLVWRQGLPQWSPAIDVPELASQLPPPVPSAYPPDLGSQRVAQERTLNPFRLFRRAFHFKGRFDRAEFAIAYLGNLFLLYAAVFAFAIFLELAGVKERNRDALLGALMIVWLPFAFIINIGSGVRRLHDLGKPGWYMVLAFVPCVNFLMVLYLCLAPGSEGPTVQDTTSSVIIAIAAAFVGIMLVGIVAAIAIPSLLRARISANESAAIGDLRAVIDAQAAYANTNKGYFESRWECLAKPSMCLPGYSGRPPLDVSLTLSPRRGYSWQLHHGQQFAPEAVPPGVSPSSTNSFAVVSVPVTAGTTGVRAFCGDSSGTICFAVKGSSDSLVETLDSAPWLRCSSTCTPLR